MPSISGTKTIARPCISRRTLLSLPVIGSAPLLGSAIVGVAEARGADGVVLDEPMRRLRLPKGSVGRDYVLMQLRVKDQGPYEFMVGLLGCM